MDSKRIRSLDGLRAMAILLVVGYHYFSRWSPPKSPENLYPHGSTFADWPAFSMGYLGVELFFIISGFVIALTLQSSSSPFSFGVRRFARLFPAMLLCSIATILIVRAFDAPYFLFRAQWENLLPSLTFSDPAIWNWLFGHRFEEVDGAYWSLQVEVKFYFWAAVLYFMGPQEKFGRRFLAFFTIAMLVYALQSTSSGAARVAEHILIGQYLPWFAAGVGFYLLTVRSRDVVGWLLILEALIARAAFDTPAQLVVTVLFFGLFAVALFTPQYVTLLRSKPVSSLGEASYSFYLLHQVIGVTILDATLDSFGMNVALGVLTAAAITICLGFLSFAVYRYCEIPAKRYLMRVALRSSRATANA